MCVVEFREWENELDSSDEPKLYFGKLTITSNW